MIAMKFIVGAKKNSITMVIGPVGITMLRLGLGVFQRRQRVYNVLFEVGMIGSKYNGVMPLSSLLKGYFEVQDKVIVDGDWWYTVQVNRMSWIKEQTSGLWYNHITLITTK